ncbi:uncharacterized protein [Setaria viridis]|uniref:Uncharacterized protein n=1 Tax=Setaria viridis TaxID=4556 RepID=A0A4U6SX64_SETVI|nr:uncharacterized protein LOC117840163 [Setaria viridis]TKV92944.1 hypothetical protein SEVIR_9G194700v2 [Setaria viridis]
MHLTLSPARMTRKAPVAAAAAAHARSASEPCHPALARLDGTVRALRAWSCCCGGAVGSSSSSPAYGLALLEAVLAALGDLLATPRTAAALHDADDRVLDGFLALADAYGTFGAALLAARQGVADARAGARRGDGAAVAASARAHRRTEKELRRLAAAMRHASRSGRAAVAPTPSSADAAGAEVVGVVTEATVAAAEASAAIFSRCAAMSPDVPAMAHSHRWLARLGVAPAASSKVAPETAPAALERLEELEECIAGLESGSEKVFRRLLQARVLLLNIHNPL